MTRYVATEDLYVGIFRAHLAGDEVPEDNIDRNGWGDKVAQEGTAAAEAVAPFDPATRSVSEVNDYLRETADAEETARVLALERDGKNRSGVNGL